MSPPKFDVTPEKEYGVFSFLWRQLFITPEPVTGISLEGKTAIITGSNVGVGLELSRQLLDLGLSQLILAVRSEERGRAAAANLLAGRDHKPTIHVWKLDLESYDSIVAFAKRAETLERMDFAVMNAGVLIADPKLNNSTRHDQTIQINYLSMALLVILLLPIAKSKQTAQGNTPSRFTITSSEVASWATFKEREKDPLLPAFDVPGGSPLDRMMVSKLLGQLFLTELAKRVPSTVATVNCATPGLINDSQFGREVEGRWTTTILKYIYFWPIGYKSAVGARNLTDAVVRHGQESHGCYLSAQKLKPMAPIIYSEEGEKISQRLWKETMAEFSFANVEGIIRDVGE